MKKYLFLLCIVLMLPACSLKKTKLIQAVNPAQVQNLASQMPNEFRILGFTDEENHWYSPVVSLPIIGAGETLYKHLDPSFHYGSSMDIKSFADLHGEELLISSDKFYFKKGQDRFSGELIAVLDWNNDTKNDWIVLFSLNSTSAEIASKKYYLLITDTKNYPLKTQTIALHDGFDNSFKVLMHIANSTSEYDIGASNIISAPHEQKKEAFSSESAPKDSKTTKLSE